jgi:hypothetical protein
MAKQEIRIADVKEGAEFMLADDEYTYTIMLNDETFAELWAALHECIKSSKDVKRGRIRWQDWR